MSRKEQQASAFLVDAPDIGGHVIHPLASGRLSILERRGNRFIKGTGNQNEMDAAAEVFFVVTREPADLVAMRRLDSDDWRDHVEAFALELSPGDLDEFGKYLESEMSDIDAGATKPGKTKRAERERSQTGSPSPSASGCG